MSHDFRVISRFIPITVCRDSVVSFFICVIDSRYGVAFGHHGIGVCDDGQADMKRHDPFLGQIIWHQFCPRCHHRDYAGVSVWHKLGLLFALCGGYFWCVIGD